MHLIRSAAPLALGIVLSATGVGVLDSARVPASADTGPASPSWIDPAAGQPSPVVMPDGADVDAAPRDVPNIAVGPDVPDVPADLGKLVCSQLAAGASRDAIVEQLVDGPEAFAPEEADGLVDQAPGEWCPQLDQ